ncbi:MAG: DEAD/DEAH box helicase [Candidatus Puniceispirillales bacterium]
MYIITLSYLLLSGMLKNDTINKTLNDNINKKGFTKFTDVQNFVIDEKNVGRDLLVSSQTGSGKTLAYSLSISDEILISKGKDPSTPSGLIITPTRELALQVYQEIKWLFEKTDLTAVTSIGGMDINKERAKLKRKFNLLIGTPGRINDHLRKKYLNLSKLSVLVLDEADEMLDLGFKEDLDKIIQSSPENSRKLLFSATLPKKIISLANKYQKNPKRIEVSNQNVPHKDISYESYFINKKDTENAIFNLLRFYDDKNILIFCSTRSSVTHIHSRLLNRGFGVVCLSGALNQSERFKALQAMKNGRSRICVATDVAARGIDLVNLDIVVHADLPRNGESLLHRSGRTGRAGNKGKSILFFSPNEIRHYDNLVMHSKIKPKLNKFISKEQIEKKDNKRVIANIFSEDKVIDSEKMILQKIVDKFSFEEIALAYIRKIKKGLSPIEDVEDISGTLDELKSKPRFKNSKKGKGRNFKFKSRRNRKK